MCDLLQVKWSETERIQKDGAEHHMCITHTQTQRTCSGITHLFIRGPGGRQPVRTGARDEERLHGQVLLLMLGGTVGASHGGILLKVRRDDLSVTSARARY